MIAWIGLGGNLGNVREKMARAIAALDTPHSRVELVSDLYRSDPYGPADQPEFLNAVLRLATAWTPAQLLGELKRIERQLGRKKRDTWREREIDLDLLLAKEDGWLEVRSAELRVPHVDWQNRAFVLQPLLELDADFCDPDSGEAVRNWLDRSELKKQQVERIKTEQAWHQVI